MFILPAGRARTMGLAILTILLAAASPAAATGHGDGPAGFTRIAQAPSSPPDGVRAFQWRMFSSRPGGFGVEFPGRPEVSRRMIRTEIGDVISIRHTAGDGMHATYDVTYNEYPADRLGRLTPRKMVTAARDSLVQQAKGRLVSEKPVSLGKAAGRDCEIIGADGMRYEIRLLVDGSRMYQLIAMAQPPARPDTRKFFDSFRLTGTR